MNARFQQNQIIFTLINISPVKSDQCIGVRGDAFVHSPSMKVENTVQ